MADEADTRGVERRLQIIRHAWGKDQAWIDGQLLLSEAKDDIRVLFATIDAEVRRAEEAERELDLHRKGEYLANLDNQRLREALERIVQLAPSYSAMKMRSVAAAALDREGE